MRVLRVVGTSLLTAVPTLILATFIVFFMQRLIPGDPAVALAGEYATPERLAEIRADLGLDQPMLVQYWDWIRNAFTGNLGASFLSGQPVTEQILSRLPLTLLLTLFALIVAVVIGLPTGVWAAQNAESRLDRFLTTSATLGLAMPNFWLGMMLIIVFSMGLGLFPGPGGPSLQDDPAEALRGLVLPAMALGLVGGAEICRQVRSAMIENLGADYVRTHRAKALPESRIVWLHALKNSSLPFATIIGLQVSRLIGSAVVVEAVFGLPGLGSLVVDATNQRDYAVIQGVVLVAAVVVLFTNTLVDISYRLLDPRIS
ncbi:ABC transporter permease [Nocardioides albus]|uniref:Peptide/nickel transport system permease protein n=1 Tax=Nocardioides albus TaxID=1841 RepID=A0A7W5A3G3_9ACTN|nr:ABC transporter permease [Nocardioides albus]MBB3088996.1 peptide/nickel transport system permease protein [Nocardioides albus]GGU14927.1 peptide ABC transporter [Nocardioides albus]